MSADSHDPVRDRSSSRAEAVHAHRAYGLSLTSFLPLPELGPASGPADVAVKRASAPLPAQARPARSGEVRAVGGGLLYHLEGVGSFVARDGRVLEVDAAPGLEERVLRLPMLGPALSLVLHQRGHLLLHASALDVDGRAVLFLSGHHGGKSTMAAGMAVRGHRILADDLVCVDLATRPGRVLASGSQIKLCPDAAEALVPHGVPLHPLHPATDKVGVRLPEWMATAPVPPSRLYVLEPGERIEIGRLDPDRAVEALIRGWYGARFGTTLLDILDRGALFLGLVRLAEQLQVRTLARPADLDLLPRVTAAVEEDILSHH